MPGEMVMARSCEHFRLELMGPGPETGITRLVISDNHHLIALELELRPEQVEIVANWMGPHGARPGVSEMTENTGKT